VEVLLSVQEFDFELHFIHPLFKGELALVFLEMVLKSEFEK
jgi:carbonic anhydrase